MNHKEFSKESRGLEFDKYKNYFIKLLKAIFYFSVIYIVSSSFLADGILSPSYLSILFPSFFVAFYLFYDVIVSDIKEQKKPQEQKVFFYATILGTLILIIVISGVISELFHAPYLINSSEEQLRKNLMQTCEEYSSDQSLSYESSKYFCSGLTSRLEDIFIK